jgi:hypothetical protein
MTQLDGVELGHSSMIFDLRYVPEDTRWELMISGWKCSQASLSAQHCPNLLYC